MGDSILVPKEFRMVDSLFKFKILLNVQFLKKSILNYNSKLTNVIVDIRLLYIRNLTN